MAHDVFISYSHVNKSIADAICSKMEGNSIRCWYYHRDSVPGRNYAGELTDAIESARFFVVILTNESLESSPVLKELSIAADHGCVIIPIKITAAQLNKDFKFYLNAVNWIDAVTPELSDHIDELVRTVCKLMGKKPNQRPIEQSDVPAPDMPAPEEPVPDVPAPDMPAPEEPVPDVPAPDMPAPEEPVPDVPAPDVPAPDVLVADVPEPDVPGDAGNKNPAETEDEKEFDLPAHLSFHDLIGMMAECLEGFALNGVKESKDGPTASLKCVVRYEVSGKNKDIVVNVSAAIQEDRHVKVTIRQRLPIRVRDAFLGAAAFVVNPLIGGAAVVAMAALKAEENPGLKETLFQEIDRFLDA